MPIQNAEEFFAPDRATWRAWLAEHHERTEGVWLVTHKKATGKPFVSYNDSVEEALCFGWVDSLPRAISDERHALYFAPRKKGSRWSKPNQERVARLEAAGLMMPAGRAKVDTAKQNGLWNALDDVEAGIVPDDLAARLAANSQAQANWNAFPPSVRRGILEWLLSAKRPETRNKRLDQIVEQAAQNRRANFERKTSATNPAR